MPKALIAVLFSVAVGFVAAGICTSAYALLTRSRLKFEPPDYNRHQSTWRIGLLVVGGPLVIMGNAVRAARLGLRPKVWLVATTVLASGWSFCLGLAVINLLLAVAAFAG